MRLTPAHKELGYTKKDFLFNWKDKIKDKRFRVSKKRGFAESELWSLDHTIALFVYPRLKAFNENNIGHPIFFYVTDGKEMKQGTIEEWKKEVEKMVRAFELVLRDEHNSTYLTEEEIEEVQTGLLSFAYNFHDLWT